MVSKIEKWKNDDLFYIKTRATHRVHDCIIKHKCVSVTGPSGIGKTALVRHIALQMKRDGYTLLEVSHATEIKRYFKLDRKTLYIVDDMCGNFSANQSRLETWKESMNDIKSILENHQYKLVLTCRLQVFQDKGFRNLDIFKTCECNLMSEDLSLSYYEKENMTRQYFGEYASEALTHLGEYDFLPFLCKLYKVQKNKQPIDIKMFFYDPFSFYEKELPSMYEDCIEGKYKYCALLLLVMFNNKLEDENLTGEDHCVKGILQYMMEVFETEHLTGRKLKSQLQILIGTFVTYDEGIYRIIHDKLFDFLAVYFGRQEESITLLIKHAKDRFVCERFIVKGDNTDTQYLIGIVDDKLEMYVKRVFEDMVKSCNLNTFMYENKNLLNVKFRTMFLNFMRNHNNYEILVVIDTASIVFLNTMFVMKEENSKDNFSNIWENENFCIILPDNMLKKYIKRWFDALTKTSIIKDFLQQNRLFVHAKFRSALCTYILNLNTDTIASLIEKGTDDFINTLFFMKEDVIKDKTMDYYKWVGIVIPGDLLQKYIKKWFKCWSLFNYDNTYSLPSNSITQFLDDSRPMMDVTFRNALRMYINSLNEEDIDLLIQTSTVEFINTMFVMKIGDTNDNNRDQFESFDIVISRDLLQQYIKRLFDELTESYSVEGIIDENRLVMNVSFRTAFREYLIQLPRDKISVIIKTAEDDFINLMFVMEENDIKDIAVKQYECFGIVIPDNLLQQYIERLFGNLTNNSNMHDANVGNRPLMNVLFRRAVRCHMRQLEIEKIASIIQTADGVFFNTMFVKTDNDINVNAENGYECFSIVIHDDLLQQYIMKWFENLTKSSNVKYAITENRPLVNVAFRNDVNNHMKQLTTEKIDSIMQTAGDDFLNTIFVKTEDDIKDNFEIGYECFGIVIPDDLLEQYIVFWLEVLKKSTSVKNAIYENRPFLNVTFRIDVRNHLKQLTTEQISSMICTEEYDFVNTMFVKTKEDIKNNVGNVHECFGIVIPDGVLQQYIEALFNNLTKTYSVETIINDNRMLMNVTFRTDFQTYLTHLHSDRINSIILTAEDSFFELMFVMAKEDIKDHAEKKYECFGIVMPDELLQQYMKRLFDNLTKTLSVKRIIKDNRMLMNITFRTDFQTYLRQLHTDKISAIIKTGEDDFINLMFVMEKNDIKDIAVEQYECFGIVIPDDLLQQYIERLLDNLNNIFYMHPFIVYNRPLTNILFRRAVRCHMRQLQTEKNASIIHTAGQHIFNTMFVKTDNDINVNAENEYECFSIVIADDLLRQYIMKWFKDLTNSRSVRAAIEKNKLFGNVAFRNDVRNQMKQLTRTQIAAIIQTAGDDFLNTMFVKSGDDIKDNVESRHECFGIVIPDDLLQQYILKWFDHLKSSSVRNAFDENRLLMNNAFRCKVRTHLNQLTTEHIASIIRRSDNDFFNTMFVKSEDDIKKNVGNGHECFGIVIPDDLLQQYIIKWLDYLMQSGSVRNAIYENRPFLNGTFRNNVRHHMKQLTTEHIASIIHRSGNDFFNTMFIKSDNDIKDNVENGHECFGIVIPGDLLKQYIMTWIDALMKSSSVKRAINENRPFLDITFRNDVREHMKQLTTVQIVSILYTADHDFLNIMFVRTEDDIDDNDKDRFECLGIVIPEDLLLKYIEKWFGNLTKTYCVKDYFNNCRLLNNVSCRTALRTYMKQQNTDKVTLLIRTGNTDFLNTMFVMSNDDIKENAAIRYECFGIVIPDNMLQRYIESWFVETCLRSGTECGIDTNRLMMNVTFCTALQLFMRNLTTDRVVSSIETGSRYFLNKMFVMTEEDLENNSCNRHKYFGIVIQDHDPFLLEQYIDRWFNTLTTDDSVNECINANQPLINATCCTALQTFITKLTTERIDSFIQNGSTDFLNRMFVMTEEDIQNNSGNRYERFGIVIPDDPILLQQYIETWIDKLTHANSVRECINANRPMMNSTFQTALRTFMGQLDTEEIRTIIQTSSSDFLNTMFVLTDNEIVIDADDQFESFCIVIPDDMLQQYTERWIDCMKKVNSVMEFVSVNRSSMSVILQSELAAYIK